jgi:hypothetical protein
MTQGIDRVCDQLRIKLHGMDRRLEMLKANGSGVADKSRHLLESQMDFVSQRIVDRRPAVQVASDTVAARIGERGANLEADECRSRLVPELAARADDAEAYALAVFELAMAAVDEAAKAALQALLARGDAACAAVPAVSRRSASAPPATARWHQGA